MKILSKFSLFLTIIFAILLFRSFVIEPFRIPTSSMSPTLLAGDHILVHRFAYGLRLPYSTKWIARFGEPERGDVVIFSHPDDPNIDYVKRVVGVPGDHIEIRSGELFLNGKNLQSNAYHFSSADRVDRCTALMDNVSTQNIPNNLKPIPYFRKHQNYTFATEDMENGLIHLIQRSKNNPDDIELMTTIPEGKYFVMGDNRDRSQDSRVFGAIPRDYLKGKVDSVWMSFVSDGLKCTSPMSGKKNSSSIRWYRVGRSIY